LTNCYASRLKGACRGLPASAQQLDTSCRIRRIDTASLEVFRNVRNSRSESHRNVSANAVTCRHGNQFAAAAITSQYSAIVEAKENESERKDNFIAM